MKTLEQLVGTGVATKLVTELRGAAEDLFEPPGVGADLDEICDTIWTMYLAEDLGTRHPKAVVGAARRAFREIYEQLAEQRGFGRGGKQRRRFLSQLAGALADDVSGYKKIDPDTYTPTAADLAKLERFTLEVGCAFIDVATQLTGLHELELYGTAERERGLSKTLAAAIPASRLRSLTLNGTKANALDGALANPVWAKLDYLALYECEAPPAMVGAAVERWSALTTLAIRSDAKLGAAILASLAPAAPRLVELALINGQLSDAPIQQLLLDRPWPKLKRLYLGGNKLSPAMIKALAQKLPKVKLDTSD